MTRARSQRPDAGGRRHARRLGALAGALLCALFVQSAGAYSAQDGDDDAYWVVRFRDRITDSDRSFLLGRGLEIVDYEPHNSYIVWGGGAEAASARGRHSVLGVGPLDLHRVLHPALKDARGVRLVDVTAHPSALAPLQRVAAPTASRPSARIDGTAVTLTARIPAALLPALASRSDVLYVAPAGQRLTPEDEATAQVQAGNVGEDGLPVVGYTDWLAEQGVDGSGVLVAVTDTGISDAHPDLEGRVVARVDYSGGVDNRDLGGHGTHVAGILGGVPRDPFLLRDPAGFALGQGVAPGVGLIDLNVLTREGSGPVDIGLYARDAAHHGARIWNASWHTGGGSRRGYVADARLLDGLVRDANPETPDAEEFLFVFSAGNAGGSGPTTPKEAKNIIAVGSVISGRGTHGLVRAPATSVADTSSRGPTLDGRIFPTLSAPGNSVSSARTMNAGYVALAGTCLPPPGSVVHVVCSGTSMAAPHVAGAAALLHQWWVRRHGALPSPTLAKAILVSGAQDVGGRNIPNNAEGWGRLNLANVFTGAPYLAFDQAERLHELDQVSARTIEVVDAGAPLKVTLAWADPPGAEGANPALVNDLDLVVERLDADGAVRERWLGNVFSVGRSVEGGVHDRLNNLENVYVDAPSPGRYRISVRAANLPGNGVAGNEDATDQDFALFVRNARAT